MQAGTLRILSARQGGGKRQAMGLLVFLHEERGQHRASLLGDREPAGNVGFEQPSDYRG